MPANSLDVLWPVLDAMAVMFLIVIAFVASVFVGQRKSIRAITKSEKKFRYVFENSVVGMLRFDPATGRVIEANQALLSILGTPSIDDVPALLGLSGSNGQTELVQQLLTTKRVEGREILVRNKDRKPVWVSFFGVVNETEGYCEAVVADISQQKKANLLQRQLTHRIVEAEENERRRVARELHDGVNQTLSLVKGKLSFLAERSPAGQRKLRKSSTDARELLDSAINDVRRISRNLRPSVLDDLGFLPAVRSLIDGLLSRTRIKVRLEAGEGLKRTPRHIELALYRIIQESLTNVERYAKATGVVVRIAETRSAARIEVADNGVGLLRKVRKRREDSSGMGIKGMRERVELLGGTFSATSTAKRGTTITAEIPFREQLGRSRSHVLH